MTTPRGPVRTVGTSSVAARGAASSVLVAAALGTVYVAWGSTYLAVKVMVESMPALVGSGTRALAAGTLLAIGVGAWRGPRALRVTGTELAGCTTVALLLLVAGQGLVAVAEDRGAASGMAALVVAAVPLWVVCLRALAGERPRARTNAGVLTGFAGVAVLIGDTRLHGSAPTAALLLVVLASMFWALGSWLQPRLTVPANPFVLVVHEMLIGGTVLCVLGVARGERLTPESVTADAWTAWAFLVLVGSILALTAYNWLLQVASVSVVATYAYVNPVIAVWLGWLLLREPVTGTTLFAAAVVVAGVAMVVFSERRGS